MKSFSPASMCAAVSKTILPDGRLRLGAKTGSIHTLGRELLGAPYNGWEHWLHVEPLSGEKKPLNDLREKYLELARKD